MAQQGEKASAQFVVPYLDFVIVTSTDNQRICFVEIDATDWSIVLFEAIDDGTDSIIPTAVPLRVAIEDRMNEREDSIEDEEERAMRLREPNKGKVEE